VKRSGRLIGLDLGSRRIGVAVTDTDQTVATGVRVITRSGDRRVDHTAIAALVSEYEAAGVVVGLPLSLSGRTGPAARQVLEEVGQIADAVGVEVATMDERLTSVAAGGSLRAGGRDTRRQRPMVDQTAAALLLQTWIEKGKTAGKGCP
jgi:putative Holliday junction resolvase